MDFSKEESGGLNHSLSLMFLNIIHEGILFKVAAWRSAACGTKKSNISRGQ